MEKVTEHPHGFVLTIYATIFKNMGHVTSFE